MLKMGEAAADLDKKVPLSEKRGSLNSFTFEEFNNLLKQVTDLVLKNSGKELIGLTLEELVKECDIDVGKMQHLLATLGKEVKRTKHGTYFHMSRIRTIPKKVRAGLFY